MKSYLVLFFAFILLNGSSLKAFSQVSDSLVNKSSAISYGVNAGFSNKYLWRGMCYNNGLVLQPEIWASYGNFALSSWSNITIWDKDKVKSNEVDLILTYTNTIFNFDIEGALNYYYFINQEGVPNTSEFYLGISYPLGNFSIFTGLYVDILETPGAIYNELGVGYEKELSDKLTISGSLFTGMASNKFNEYYLAINELNKSPFNLASANLNLTFAPTEDFFIDAHFQYNHTLEQELTTTLLNANSNYFEIIFRKEF